MADGVDARVQLVQTAGSQASTDGTRPKTQVKQLIPRHHSVLTLRQVSDLSLQIASPRQCPHIGLSGGLGEHGTEVGGKHRACGAQIVSIGFPK
jgi:hypothetical protein